MFDKLLLLDKIDWDEYSPILKIGAEKMSTDPEWARPLLEIVFRQIAEIVSGRGDI